MEIRRKANSYKRQHILLFKAMKTEHKQNKVLCFVHIRRRSFSAVFSQSCKKNPTTLNCRKKLKITKKSEKKTQLLIYIKKKRGVAKDLLNMN